MYYLREAKTTKGADQLRGYHEADLRLYFRLCRLLVFPCGGSNGAVAPQEKKAFTLKPNCKTYLNSSLCALLQGNIHATTERGCLSAGRILFKVLAYDTRY